MLNKFELSKQEIIQLDKLIKQEKNAKISRRLQCLKLKHKGKTHQEIIEIFGVNKDTISYWLKIYTQEGLNGLCKLKYDGRRKTKLDDHIDQIKQDVKDKTVSTLAELQSLLNEKYNIQIEESWLSRLAKKNLILPTKRLV